MEDEIIKIDDSTIEIKQIPAPITTRFNRPFVERQIKQLQDKIDYWNNILTKMNRLGVVAIEEQ